VTQRTFVVELAALAEYFEVQEEESRRSEKRKRPECRHGCSVHAFCGSRNSDCF